MKKLRVALLSGGWSTEREISLKTGRQIAGHLNRQKYQVSLFDPKENLMEFLAALKKEKFDLVFPALHGALGEDGTLQGMLEIFQIPYVFSGVLTSAIAMDKIMTKKLLAGKKIFLPRDVVLEKGFKMGVLKKIKLPAVVKPIDQGSSVGTFIVKTEKERNRAIREAFKFGSKIMVEEFIKGREITAAVLGNKNPRALPLIEIRPKVSSFFDYRAKYEAGGSEEICPAPIGKILTKKIQTMAVKIHQILGCQGVTRSDFILTSEDDAPAGISSERSQNTERSCILKSSRPYFLEINTIPGMTEMSLVPQAAARAGISFPKLLDKLIELALVK